MKKRAALLLALIFYVSALCSGIAEQAAKAPLGRLTKVGISEEELNAKVEEGLIELPLFSGFKYFDTYNSMIVALDSGSIGAINIDEYMVNYLVSRTDSFAPFKNPDAFEYQLSFSMLMREEDGELCGRISGVIAEMKAVGSLLIVALSLNMLGLTKIKVMNSVPAVFFPILLCTFL